MAATFTVTEIRNQANSIKTKAESFKGSSNDMIRELTSVQALIISEDSNLAERIRDLANTYTRLWTVLDEKFLSLVEIMENYCNRTRSNEEEATQAIASVTKSNNDILGTLQQLMNKWNI